MSRLYLIPTSKKRLQGKWELILGRERAQLIDPEGYIEADFPLEEAHKRFKIPGFLKKAFDTASRFGIKTDQNGFFHFVSMKHIVDEIHRYLAYALAQRGPGAITSVKWQGWLLVFFGIAVILLGLVILALGVVLNNGQPPPNVFFSFPFLIAVLGLGAAMTGVMYLNRARAAEVEWGEDDEDEGEDHYLVELED